MTISTIYAPVVSAVNGVGPYAFVFDVLSGDDIIVSLDEAILAPTEYTVVLTGTAPIFSGGDVTLNDIPAAEVTVVVVSRDTLLNHNHA